MTKPWMIDTHCHLESEDFNQDRDLIIRRAAKLGISIITSGTEPEVWSKSCDISNAYPNVYASIGLNPTYFERCDLAIEWIRQNHERIISIGEIGLDHYLVRDHQDRDEQIVCFERLINLATELRLPIQIHSRSAGKKALEILSKNNAVDVHMHAFDGKSSLVRTASHDLGYYFSIPTSVVRSPQKRKIVRAVEIEHLLLETDSPVLGAEKGIRNEPSNLPIVVQEISKILGREEEELRKISVENTLRLYSL